MLRCMCFALAATLSFPATASVVSPVFEEDFSDNLAGWTLGPEWQIGSAVAGCGDPGRDHTPSADNGIAGVVIGGCASTAPHGFSYLTSPTIDLSGSTVGSFSYWRDLYSDYTPYMKNVIEVFNGTTWVTIWETFGSPGIDDAVWTYQEFDISSSLNAMFQVRFGFGVGINGSFGQGSWNIDDVTVSVDQPSQVPVPPAAALMLAGMAGLGALRRRRRAA